LSLHSFPPRRSSDLPPRSNSQYHSANAITFVSQIPAPDARILIALTLTPVTITCTNSAVETAFVTASISTSSRDRRRSSGRSIRSEEHTSELQSRVD